MPSPSLTIPGQPTRVLWLSTIAFTVLFAAWLMLGVLGLKIKADPRLMLGDAAQAMQPAEIKSAIESRFEWLLAAAILGQVVASLLIDHYGWLEAPVQRLSAPRLIGAALLVGGVVLIRWR